jgi:hypothetical protein
METSVKQTILSKLKGIDGSIILDTTDWPKAYFKNLDNIKAIVLGCDPSNQHDRNLKYAFGIETKTPLLKQFFAGIENNLMEVGLSREDIYVQNLCQNYFTQETSKNGLWQAAAKVWIPYLKDELDTLPITKDVPVFLTAGDLYKVLIKEGARKHEPKDLYSNPNLLPISADDNYLERPLFPLFRGGQGYYDLKKWPEYIERLKGHLKELEYRK